MTNSKKLSPSSAQGGEAKTGKGDSMATFSLSDPGRMIIFSETVKVPYCLPLWYTSIVFSCLIPLMGTSSWKRTGRRRRGKVKACYDTWSNNSKRRTMGSLACPISSSAPTGNIHQKRPRQRRRPTTLTAIILVKQLQLYQISRTNSIVVIHSEVDSLKAVGVKGWDGLIPLGIQCGFLLLWFELLTSTLNHNIWIWLAVDIWTRWCKQIWVKIFLLAQEKPLRPIRGAENKFCSRFMTLMRLD